MSVSNVRNMPNGMIAINCKTSEEIIKFRDEASKILGENYDVQIPSSRKMNVKVTNLDQLYECDKLMESFTAQNDATGSFTVVKVYKNKNKDVYEAILQCDEDAYNNIMSTGKVKIGWNICKVDDFIKVSRCFKCCGYNHTAANCKNNVACMKCGKEHMMKDCTSDSNECVNCTKAVHKFNINIGTNHPVWSRECTVYKRKLESESKKAQYNM